MSGHSKWKTIKHKKAATDAKRSKEFSKLIKEITVAARLGGGDLSGNSRLRLLLDKAKEINMPKSNVDRAIKKGTGELPGGTYESFLYEGYGPGGIAVLIEVLTDNKNKAAADLRHVFSRYGSNMGETGSVAWMFERLGAIRFEHDDLSEDRLLEKLLEYDVKDVSKDGSLFLVTCGIKALEEIKKFLLDLGIKIDESEVEWIAKEGIDLQEKYVDKAVQFLEDADALEEVQNVYSNFTG